MSKKPVVLICQDCDARNYHVKQTNKRMVAKKYCPTCNKVTIHKESR